ncbi:MAG TPA: aminotransferase class I/II-fold pyridoxal phosphate-dependent enzyme, partial [Candidatus Bathyarchaeia archaeon]|nr:aminotransferase class I/II-fold pyridoxal phosphate-dependent enzyme [Candidatus Bathyarchaeia archaeon]
LRKEIVHFLKRRFGMSPYDPEEEVLITVGVSEGVDLALRAILNPGDKILIPEPSYVSYKPMSSLAGGNPISLLTGIENGFKVTPEQVDEACRKHKNVKAFLFNYPCNPTGASYTRAELLAMTKVVKKHDLIVISDEVYDELTYDFDHTPIASLPGMRERVIYLNGFSKAYAMTGSRLGWAAGPKDILAAMTKIHQYTIMCASISSQLAGIEALRHGARSVAEMKREYARRRRYIVDALNEIGLECHKPQGTFYVFPSVKSTGKTGMAFAQELLKAKKVALVPGVAFGPEFEYNVRIAYAASYDDLKESVKRIKEYLATLA